MAKINRINPEGISKPFSNYSHVVTAEGAQKLVFCAGQSVELGHRDDRRSRGA